MADNKIFPFADQADAGSILSDSDYEKDEDRPVGNEPGKARSAFVNKALRQSNAIAGGLAQWIADHQDQDVSDSESFDVLAGYFQNAIDRIVDDAKKQMQLPVGSVYQNSKDSSNPATLLGYGTWSALGPGRTLLGVSENHPLGEKGGAETVGLTADQNGTHRHYEFHGGGDNDRVTDSTYSVASESNTGDKQYELRGYAGGEPNLGQTGVSGNGEPHENMMPYQAVYQWERVK